MPVLDRMAAVDDGAGIGGAGDEITDESVDLAALDGLDGFDAFDGFAAYEIEVDVDPFARAELARLDASPLDTGEASISTDEPIEAGGAANALLRPPSRPTPPAPPPTATRAAMDALFEGDDASGAGLVLFGDGMDAELEGAPGFAPQPGTDPDMAPLPAEGGEGGGGSARGGSEGERTEDTSRPEPVAAPDDAVLAGAEAPSPMDGRDAPFGFGFGDDEPTIAAPRPEELARDEEVDRRGARRDETLLSSVRKLFGR